MSAAAMNAPLRSSHRDLTMLVALAVATGLFGCRADPPLAPEVRTVRTLEVGADAGAAEATYSGEIRAQHESAVAFRIGGRVVERLVQAGDHVRTGQPLARLDANDAALNEASARAAEASARSEYAQAQLDYERSRGLHAKRFVSDAELDRDRVRLEGARAQLDAATAQAALARNQQAYTTLRAPFDGVVTQVTLEAGQVVIAGQSVVQVAAQGDREVEISVPESRLADLRQATGFVVELWARTGWRYDGRLRELAPATDGATRQYTARIAIPNADAAVDLGMTARVHVRLPIRDRTIALPVAALLQKDDGSYVWVVNAKDGRVHARRVQVQSLEREAVRIAAGLSPGERVVTAGVHLLYDGQPVRTAVPAAGRA